MRSSSGGLFTTLLMFVPLIAVPAMAIFGVPNGDPLSASPDVDAVAPELSAASIEAPRAPAAAPPEVESLGGDGFLPAGEGFLGNGTGDPFLQSGRAPAARPSSVRRDAAPLSDAEGNPFGNAPRTSSTGANGTKSRATRSDEDVRRAAADRPLAGEHTPDSTPRAEARTASADVESSPFRSASAAGSTAASALDWPSAVRRLKDLGIREYQLVPGEKENGFLFVCDYAAPENPRIVHRFEAEAVDPLTAVQDVLSQVERWLDRR